MLTLLIFSLVLNAITLGIFIWIVATTPPGFDDVHPPASASSAPAPSIQHPALEKQAIAAVVAAAVERVKRDAAFRAKVLDVIPVGDGQRMSFAKLCHRFADALNLSTKETSRILIYLCHTERVIFTDGQSYWR